MYTRASASDYDDWENVHGNPGWGSKDLIPLLEKVWSMYSYKTQKACANIQVRPKRIKSNPMRRLMDTLAL